VRASNKGGPESDDKNKSEGADFFSFFSPLNLMLCTSTCQFLSQQLRKTWPVAHYSLDNPNPEKELEFLFPFCKIMFEI
jgi:hypothetical protein